MSMGRLRALGVGLALLAGSAWPIVGAPGAACAAEGPRAALVVDTGRRVLTYCVALDAATVTGTHLIELAGAQHGLSYALGFGGQAVCRLAGVGPSGGDCFADYPSFWGYWHGDGSGGWSWSSGGAASYRVEDGDVEGWAWGTGDTPATHPAPPATRASDVCTSPSPSPPAAPTPKTSPTPAGEGDGGPGSATSASPSTGEASPAASASPATSTEPGETDSATPSAAIDPEDDATASGTLVAAPVKPSDGPGGPAPGLLAAAGIALALAGAGWLRLRSRAKGARG